MVPDALQDSVCDEQLMSIDGEFALSEKKRKKQKSEKKFEKTKIGKKKSKKQIEKKNKSKKK